MRVQGISYDTGFIDNGKSSRADLDPATVERELRVIRDDLHCDAVRIMGGDPARIETAAGIAADLGLEVWFSPYPLELAEDEILAMFADCAERAERLRRTGAEIVFVAGAEMSLMNKGFLPGDRTADRVALLLRPDLLREHIGTLSGRVNAFLGKAAEVVRARFGGRLTYASVPLENVDWTPFDIVSVDLYRSAETADRFAAGVRGLVAQGRPVAITEFGSAGYRGAADLGANGLDLVEYDTARGPVRLKEARERDEEGQAACVRELLEIFDEAGVDATFVFTFALYDHVHRPDAADPRDDIDLASYGVVKVYEDRHGTTYPDLPWEPKKAFTAVADFHGAR